MDYRTVITPPMGLYTGVDDTYPGGSNGHPAVLIRKKIPINKFVKWMHSDTGGGVTAQVNELRLYMTSGATTGVCPRMYGFMKTVYQDDS